MSRKSSRVDLAEVALGIDKRSEQRLVPFGETDHRVVDGRVAVGVVAHGGAHDVGAFGARSGEKAHLIHAVEQLAVAGLEAVDLGDGARDDHAHGVGHEIALERFRDGLLHHHRAQAEDFHLLGRCTVRYGLFLLLCHKSIPYEPVMTTGRQIIKRYIRTLLRRGPPDQDSGGRPPRCAPCARQDCRPQAGRTRGRSPRRPRASRGSAGGSRGSWW